MEPEFLQLGRVAVGTTRTETVRVKAQSGEAFEITEVIPGDPKRIQATVVRGPEGPSVKVTFDAGTTPGVVTGQMRIRTTHPKAAEVSLAYRAEVAGDLSATPTRIQIPPVREGEPRPPIEVKVVSESGKPFKIVKVEDAAGLIQGKVQPGKDGVTIALTAGTVPRGTNGTLVLTTNRKDQPTLTVPYFVGGANRPPLAPGVQRRPPAPIKPPMPVLPKRGT
jgi:hypothetical protein